MWTPGRYPSTVGWLANPAGAIALALHVFGHRTAATNAEGRVQYSFEAGYDLWFSFVLLLVAVCLAETHVGRRGSAASRRKKDA